MVSEVFSQRRNDSRCARVNTRNVNLPSGGGTDPPLSLLLTISTLSFVGVGPVACVVGTLGVSLHL